MMTGQLLLRRAEPSDLDAVLAIERDSFADPWSVESFQSALALPRMRFCVVEDQGAGPDAPSSIIGYVIALVIAGEGEVADLAVSPAARRRGVGGFLLDSMIAELRSEGVVILYLEVRESNEAARMLYESRGFVAVGRRRGYYRHPVEDALVLKRDIAPS